VTTPIRYESHQKPYLYIHRCGDTEQCLEKNWPFLTFATCTVMLVIIITIHVTDLNYSSQYGQEGNSKRHTNSLWEGVAPRSTSENTFFSNAPGLQGR